VSEPPAVTERSSIRALTLADWGRAVAFGAFSYGLGYFQFRIPGVEGGIGDLREVGLFIAAFHLPHWVLVVLVGLLTSFATPAAGSLLSTMAMQSVGAVAAWFAHRWLAANVKNPIAIAATWAFFVVLWYAVLLVPIMVLGYSLAGLVPAGGGPAMYTAVLRAIPFEVLATSTTTALYLTNVLLFEQRLRAEAALRDRERWVAGVVRTIPVGVAVVSDGKVVFVNDRLAEIVGRPKDELLMGDLSWLGRAPDETVETTASPTGTRHPSGRGAEVTLRRPDGREVRAIVNAAAAQSGEVEELTLSVLDVTERARLEAQLRQAQKMDALGQLAGGVAHDFNNMLAIMTLAIEALRARAKRGETFLEPLAGMDEAIGRAKGLVRQLLSFARRVPATPLAIDLGEVVSRSVTLVSALLGSTIQTEVAIPSGLPAVFADPTMVEQVVMNLLINARDAIEERGDGPRIIRVSLENAVDPISHVAGVALKVADTGIGMDEATRGRLFEPFFTTKPDGKGTGLGLATVYGIAKRHGARLEVTSELGVGTTFTIVWPLALH
jgi:PAS domain S-box-containing protein